MSDINKDQVVDFLSNLTVMQMHLVQHDKFSAVIFFKKLSEHHRVSLFAAFKFIEDCHNTVNFLGGKRPLPPLLPPTHPPSPLILYMGM